MSHTGNPRANQPHPSEVPQEPTGPVVRDSLAAESIDAKGAFSENVHAAPLGVRADQSTLSNTDTSGAHVLPAAGSGSERERQDALGAGADVKGTAGLKYPSGIGKAEFSGTISGTGEYAGGPSGRGQGVSTEPAGSSDFGASTLPSTTGGPNESQIRSGDLKSSTSTSSTGAGSGGSGPATGTGVRPHVDAAPTYTSSVTGAAVPQGTFKPKGSNLDDADISNSIPQTKTFTGAIGTVNDPGRLAEREFEGRNEDPIGEFGQAGSEGGRARQNGETGGESGQYGVLGSERV